MSKVIQKAKEFGRMMKDTFSRWSDRDPFRNSTVIAYYTIFSLPGLLVIIINLTGYFFSQEKVTDKITTEVQNMIGGNTAKDVRTIITNASTNEGSTISSIIGIATLLFGATGVFYQVQQTLNIMWEVKPQPKQKFLKLIRDRVFSFGLVLAIGFLLLVSLVLSAALTALSDWVAVHLSESFNILFKVLDIIFSLSVITFLFAAIYKFLPDVKIKWRDVWIGALVTAILFVIAKFALGLYFGHTDQGSTYGAAGSIILIMLWVTYAGMILLFGAEFTQVYANRYGTRITPSEYAISTKQSTNKKDKRTDFKSRLEVKP